MPSRIVAILLSCLATTAVAAEPIRMPLWPAAAPEGDGSREPDPAATLTVHLPDEPVGTAVVICPGGGYGGLVVEPEGHGIARWLCAHGIAGIVLEYRLPAGRPFVPLLDAQRALRTVRHHAQRWRIDPHRVGIAGFSAGGHLAATAATHAAVPIVAGADAIDAESCRPDFAILVYPVITMSPEGHAGSLRNLLGADPDPQLVQEFSCELAVTAETPPAFLAHAVDDRPVPIANSELFHAALEAQGIPARLLRLPDGGHGLNGYRGPSWDAWQAGAIEWLAELGMLRTAAAPVAADILLADFEAEDYGGWRVDGTAFGSGPARGTLPGQMAVDGFVGAGLVNSFTGGDESTGALESPPFTIERDFVGFLIGGGKNLERTCLQLLVDGRVVRAATGPNDAAGGSERLEPGSFDVAEFRGRRATIRIVDDATGGWGHVNVDQIVQTDRRPATLLHAVRREIPPPGRFLNLPVKTGGPRRRLTVTVDGRALVTNDVELADGAADWWAPLDLGPHATAAVTLEVDALPSDSRGLEAVTRSAAEEHLDGLYAEPLRGQFHFSPRRGWNNDPNGLVWHDGEYHLFFQHNPYGWAWGNMHWGHAVSTDLVHWRELGDVLAPDALGPMFSGSAVVDHADTSGLGRDGVPPLVLLYTAAGTPTVQCLASSTDGRRFDKLPGNPILGEVTGGNRDPKVFWHEPTGRWVMVLYVTLPGGEQPRHTVHFFTSPNLRDWSLASVTAGEPGTNYLFECPDFFPLAVDGDPRREKWVLLGANGEYGVGGFDGTTFTPEVTRLPGHRGRGVYAPQTFSDIPAADGRRIQIGWFQTATPGMPFNQSMTLPLELRLVSTREGPRLSFTPVVELECLRARTHSRAATLEPGGPNPLAGVDADLQELRAEFRPTRSGELVVTIRGITVAFDARSDEVVVGDIRVPAPRRRDGTQTLTIYCDRTGLEVFAADGLVYVPLPVAPAADARGVSVEARGGPVVCTRLDLHELRSAWETP